MNQSPLFAELVLALDEQNAKNQVGVFRKLPVGFKKIHEIILKMLRDPFCQSLYVTNHVGSSSYVHDCMLLKIDS
jgi:hypothetical protein